MSLIALLTLATFFSMHQVISTQSDSALLVNISGSQRWLSQKAALLSVELVYSSNTSDRKQIREELSETIAQLQANHQTLVGGSPHIISSHRLSPQMQEMYFSPRVNMHSRLNRYSTEALALAQDPEHFLTPNNSHLIYLLQDSGNILESLDQVVSLHQKESEAKVHRLRILEITSGLIILITLAFLGLYIFRPLANTLLIERFQLENANQELIFLSSIDGLTGIANAVTLISSFMVTGDTQQRTYRTYIM